MLGRRPIAISLLLLSALPLAGVVRAIEVLDVPWRPTPKIDGMIGDAEYPAPSPVSNCKLYVCQNASFIFIAVAIPDSTYSVIDGLTICIGSEPPSLPNRTARLDDYRVIVSRSGTFTVSEDLKKFKIATNTDSGGWRAEVSIGFSELGVTAGHNKSLGFAIFIRDGGQQVARWPDDADQESPKTWGALSSSYSWGTVDLAFQSLTLGTQRPIMGENVTLYFAYMNVGSSPISGAQIGFYVDNTPLVTVDDARVIEASELYFVSAVWRATAGNHTIRIKLDPMNYIVETREDNNEHSVNIYVKPASLRVRAQEGANVTIDGNTTTVGPSREVTLNVDLGVHVIAAQETLYIGDTRYVFYKWEWDAGESNESAMALRVTGDMSIGASYRAEYLVRMRFLDGSGDDVTLPDEVRFTAPNGSSIVLNGNYDVWLQQGTITITNVIWSSVDVKPIDTTYPIQGPRTLTLNCRIYALTVEVGDGLSLPVAGANVTLVLPNTTRVWLMTDSDGKAHFAQIPAGRLGGSVSYLGFITPMAERDLAQDTNIKLSLALSLSTIVFVASIAGAMALAMILYLRKRGPRKREQKPDKLLRSLGPPT